VAINGDAMLDFERIRGAICAMYFCAGVAGLSFLCSVIKHGSDVTPELYGQFIYAIDAWVWALSISVISFVAALGAGLGSRGGAIVCAAASGLSCTVYSIFAAMALAADAGTLVSCVATFMMTPLSVLSTVSALVYILGGDHG
jgi:hypothetical protein